MRKTVSGIMLTLLLIGMLTLTFNIQPVKASGTIYIRADGSIYPPIAPISTTDKVIYTFTDNIYDSIVVERSNIIVDGNGYTLQGIGDGTGVFWSGINNVTIKNTNIKNFSHGARLDSSSDNSIYGNNITNNVYGVSLGASSNNIISGNNIAKNGEGVWLRSSSSNSIYGNNITKNGDYGVDLYSSSNYNSIFGNMFVGGGLFIDVSDSYGNVVEDNTVNGKPLVYLDGASNQTVSEAGQVILVNSEHIRVENLNLSHTSVGLQLWKTKNTHISGNNITANNRYGVYFHSSSSNTIYSNNITANNYDGVVLVSSSNCNRISGNNIANGDYGVLLEQSSNNIISGNNIANNRFGVSLDYSSNYNSIYGNNITANSAVGVSLSHSSSNSIYGNKIANNGVGVQLEWSSNYNVISGNNIANNGNGVWLDSSSDNSIYGNNITANSADGVYFYYSSVNSIYGNNITANNFRGVYLYLSSNWNSIYHNNFINNGKQAYVDSSSYNNIWNDEYPSGGNYWSTYTGVDEKSGPNQDLPGSDGIGDTPYFIDANNKDRYPLMIPYRDITPPTTFDNYDGLWHTKDFTITLNATDDLTSVAETYYKINNDPVQNVTMHGHPLITTESANNTLEYWSVDKAGNEEPYKILTGVKLDKTAPTIGTPSRIPEGDVEPNQEVKVLANVTDLISDVKNVALSYNLNDSTVWLDSPMTFNSTTGLYETAIQVQQAHTLVRYKITAYDNAGNHRVEDNGGQYYVYTVIPEFPSTIILPLLMLTTLLATVLLKKKRKPKIQLP